MSELERELLWLLRVGQETTSWLVDMIAPDDARG
jgi:hypothetical protein